MWICFQLSKSVSNTVILVCASQLPCEAQWRQGKDRGRPANLSQSTWAAGVMRRPLRFLPSSKQLCVNFYTNPHYKFAPLLAPSEKRAAYSPSCVIGGGRLFQPTSVLNICSAQSLVAQRSCRLRNCLWTFATIINRWPSFWKRSELCPAWDAAHISWFQLRLKHRLKYSALCQKLNSWERDQWLPVGLWSI